MPIHNDLLKQIENNDSTVTKVHISNTYPPLNADDMQQLVSAINKHNNPHVKTLLFYDNEIDDKGAEILSQLTCVEELALDSNEITNVGAKALAKMSNLKSLKVAGNEIGNEGFEELIKLPNLHTLVINNNSLNEKAAKDSLAKIGKSFNMLILDDEIPDSSFIQPSKGVDAPLFRSFQKQSVLSKENVQETNLKSQTDIIKSLASQQLSALSSDEKVLYVATLKEFFSKLEKNAKPDNSEDQTTFSYQKLVK
jgi:Leucine-rich repeat (LRR) protein